MNAYDNAYDKTHSMNFEANDKKLIEKYKLV